VSGDTVYRALVVLVVSIMLSGASGCAAASSSGPDAASPSGGPVAVRPVPRTDRNSQLAHAQLLDKARKSGIDVYFLGDSITRRWGTSDEQYKQFLANWRENFFGWNAANFGCGGDTVENILWRLNDGELDGVNPRVIVLLAGTNNIGNVPPRGSAEVEARASAVAAGLKAVVETCRRKAPSATIILMGITPRNDCMAAMPIINRVNQALAAQSDGKRLLYVNINDKLADADGKFYAGRANPDGLHLDVKGYQVWADALKPIFLELLGPPGKDDHAPPPTGDPSAGGR
jgi:lysophospholipase L1-like esterase